MLANAVEFLSKAISRSPGSVACSETLYFLFKVRRGRVIKYKPQGIYYRQRKEVVFFLPLRARSRALAALADVFGKNEKKNKTTSVYRAIGSEDRVLARRIEGHRVLDSLTIVTWKLLHSY